MRRYPWLVLAGFICAYDAYLIVNGHPTLSTRAAQAMRHPVRRWPVLAAWGYLSLHLSGWLSETRDPLARVARVLVPYREAR